MSTQTFSLNKFFKDNTKLWLALIAIFVSYFPTFVWMWDRWFARSSYYSHGVLIPFVVIYLIWQQKDELLKTKFKESPWGIRLIVIGLLIHLLSSLPNIRVYFSSGFSLVIVMAGIVIYFFGSEVFKKIAFPMAFLVFMIPLPLVAINKISLQLKLVAAQLATEVLNHMRIPAIREGSIIKMRHAFVIVDDVCSGLRSLISLTALGSIFAYWIKGSIWKKLFLFATTIPIAIVTNMTRVVLLSAISEIWGVEYADGAVHDATGFFVFALAFVMLFAVSKIIE